MNFNTKLQKMWKNDKIISKKREKCEAFISKKCEKIWLFLINMYIIYIVKIFTVLIDKYKNF